MSDDQPPPSKRPPSDDPPSKLNYQPKKVKPNWRHRAGKREAKLLGVTAIDVNAERPSRRSTRSRGASAVPKEQPTKNPDTPIKKTPKVHGASPSFVKSASTETKI